MFTLIYLFTSVLFYIQSNFFNQKAYVHSVAFYNVENLFDSLDDPDTFDDDYTPDGRLHWNDLLLDQKINQLAEVLSKVGRRETKRPPLIIGLVEVENRTVLELLIKHPLLKPYQYEIIHYESPDFRGIDVAFLYQKNHFTPSNHKAYKLDLVDAKNQRPRTTRDQLVVSGYLGNEELYFIIKHWPSRRGGAKRSAPSRMKAAHLHQKISDSLYRLQEEVRIVSMGDYNDNPTNKSIGYLTNQNPYHKLKYDNRMTPLFKKGIGSLAYNDQWFLFDQILTSPDWKKESSLSIVGVNVYSPAFLRNPEGKYKGYPYRVQIKGNQLKGYSDHFPVYLLVAEKLEE